MTARQILLPLALAQFICSFAGSNMNVMITDISEDLDTTVSGVQAAITLFLLIMAVFMIPCSTLTDRWGRQRCFQLGLLLYGAGALISAAAPGIGVLILGNSVLEGVGTALLIPPVYILATLAFDDVTSRAKAFGVISGMGGIGAAAGPLIGGVITEAISWRAAFVFQALVVVVILSSAGGSGTRSRPTPPSPSTGWVPCCRARACSSSSSGSCWPTTTSGSWSRSSWPERSCSPPSPSTSAAASAAARTPLLSTAVFRNRVANLGLVTQNAQWLILMGTSFTVATFLQVARGYNAIETGLIFTAATVGILVSSLAAERLAKRRPQRTLILAGFVVTIVGVGLLIGLVVSTDRIIAFVPGLLLIGLGLGAMLTPSVNVVQSSFTEARQGEISGLSRSISNLGSSFGTAIAGTILVSGLADGNGSYALAMAVLAGVGLIGLVAAAFMPRTRADARPAPAPMAAAR